MTKIEPLGGRILVRQDGEKNVSKGGILLPDASKEKPLTGTVLAVGKGRIDDTGCRLPMDVKVGDRIYFTRYAGNEVELENETLQMMEADQVLGRIVENPTNPD